MMQQHGFREQRYAGRAKFQLTVMADDEVFEECAERRREVSLQGDLFREHLEGNDDVAQQLTLGAVGKTALVAELARFADIVQHRSGQHQIEVDIAVMTAGHPRQLA